MAFRSDLEAAHARARALEVDIAALEAENARLRGETKPTSEEEDPHAPTRRFRRDMTLWMIGVAVIGGVLAGWLFTTQGEPVAIATCLVTTCAVGAFLVVLQTTVICPPGFVVVVSGRVRRRPDGSTANYRFASSLRVLRLPIVERADLLDTRARTIAVREKGAVCKGNKRVDVEVSAVINLYRTEPHIDNAIERFLGTDITDVEQAVRATLEGVLRGVVSELSVEEMSDHEKFAQLLLGSAEDLMDKLGIELRDVVIKSVSELG